MATPAEQPAMSAADYGRLVAVGALIGIPAALLAAVFLAFVHDLEHWLWHDVRRRLLRCRVRATDAVALGRVGHPGAAQARQSAAGRDR